MLQLQNGANTALPNARFSLQVATPVPRRWVSYAGLALLPVDERRQAAGEPIYAHLGDDKIADVTLDETGMRWELALAELPGAATRALLVLYAYGAQGPLLGMQQLQFDIAGVASYLLDLSNVSAHAMICLEFYQRNGAWKVRALAEGSRGSLVDLGQRLGMPLDHSTPGGELPEAAPGQAPGEIGSGREQRLPGQQWSGSGFTIGARHVLSCAHVVDGATEIVMSTHNQQRKATVVLSDAMNDIALLTVPEGPDLEPLPARLVLPAVHGEDIATLGYPLSQVMGSLQITQGCVAGVFGPQNDSRFLQLTAAIQPGSSGSPVLDRAGQILGMVTSSLRDSQNINFAVKLALIQAFLDAAEVPMQPGEDRTQLSSAQIVSSCKHAIWQLECKS